LIGPKAGLKRTSRSLFLYKILYQENVPIFITTDLLIHSLHLLFNRMLENTENQVFFYILKSLVRDFLVVLKQYETNRSDEYHVLNQAVSKMKYFFEVGEILLSNDVNIDAYDPVVREEITLINNADGFAASPVFGYKEDYSQYKPRRHYTAKERLKSYF
jgi:hypothetical protein